MGSRFGEPKSNFKMKILKNKTVIILESGDVEYLEKRTPGKGEVIHFLFVPKEEEEKFRKSIIFAGFLGALWQEGKIIYY